MSRLPGALQRFTNNNSGSAIISVVIATLFVVALGTALLFSSYTGIQVSVSSRNEKENFYNAASALDEIKAGIQDEVSTALGSAYTSVLVKYGQGEYVTDTAAQEALESAFVTNLCQLSLKNEIRPVHTSSTETTNKTVPAGSISIDGSGTYFLHRDTLIARYSTNPTGLTLSGGAVSYDTENSTITVKSLTAQHIADGYESDVTTDIVISVPDFFTGVSVAAKLGEYTIVADTGIIADAASGTGHAIKGGVFAGVDGIKVSGSNDILSISDGNVVTSGDIGGNLKNSLGIITSDGTSSTINIDAPGYEIWARGLTAAKLSTLSINGSCFVADDLEINGGSDVTLSGSYFGFGTGTTADTSSSILVNSYGIRTVNGTDFKTKLDFSTLYNLTLSGVSFIHPASKEIIDSDDGYKEAEVNAATTTANGGTKASDLLTGQSMAIKTDQLAYLVPAAAIKNYKTNPAILQYEQKKDDQDQPVFENGQPVYVPVVPEFNSSTFLWTINGAARTLEYYIGNGNGSLVTYYTQTDGDSIIYCFISFTNQDKANEYFRDYFTAKPDSITQYLDIYMALESNPNLTIISKGNTYDQQSGKWNLISGSGSSYNSTLADHYRGMFSAMTASQFESYVKELPSSTRTFSQDGKTVAVISVGGSNYIYSSDSPDMRLIIADGDVTINAPFSGIIICKGTVHVKANITATEITFIKGSVDSNGDSIESYLADGLLGGNTTTEENKWSPDNLVKYENWQKS